MVVRVNLHEQSSGDVAVQTSNGKVWVIRHVFQAMRILWHTCSEREEGGIKVYGEKELCVCVLECTLCVQGNVWLSAQHVYLHSPRNYMHMYRCTKHFVHS